VLCVFVFAIENLLETRVGLGTNDSKGRAKRVTSLRRRAPRQFAPDEAIAKRLSRVPVAGRPACVLLDRWQIRFERRSTNAIEESAAAKPRSSRGP
jgi:hypothetical protein